MITLGTGKLTHCEENELGLAGEHDYAVLDMKETGSQRLLLIKNPWCDGMVWKGSRSHPSEPSWPSELREALPETTETATRPEAQGTFWLSLNDTIQHFESLYLNWNPGLFTHRQDHHFTWTMPPISVPGSFTHNPQYSVTSTVPTTVWVLLSRHFQTAEQGLAKAAAAGTAAGTNAASGGSGANALGYISLYVFAADGARVHLSDNALHRGAYVDSPQTLAVLTLPAHTAHTVVCASQGLPLPKYAFTLSFFARSPLAVAAAPDALPHRLSVAGAWTARTAGGNAGAASYACNPQFALTVPATTDLALFLETEREEVAVHVQLVWGGGARVAAVAGRDVVGGSGDYRRGCALATLRGVAGGVYAVVCSTFEPGQLGRFTLRIGSGVECTARPVLAEGAGKLVQRLPLARFRVGCVRMLAPLSVVRLVRLMVVARGVGRRAMLRVSLEQGLGPGRVVLGQSNAGEFSDALVGSRVGEVDVGPEMGARGGAWVVVERLGGEVEGEVEVEVLSDGVVVVGVWGSGEE
jgi:calpain-7